MPRRTLTIRFPVLCKFAQVLRALDPSRRALVCAAWQVLACLCLVSVLALGSALAGPGDWKADPLALKRTATSVYTNVGAVGLNVTNVGYFGNLLNPTLASPSFEYPLNSNVEHMFVGGIWVGAITAEGDSLVSAGADDTSSGQSSPTQEYGPRPQDGIKLLSTNPLSPNFSTSALADQEFDFSIYDELGPGDSSNDDPHIAMGLRVDTKVLAYAPPYADDFVIIDFTVENVSDQELSQVYIGWYNELSVGNTTVTIPGDETNGWNFYDDRNGFIAPGDYGSDPDARIMWCHDADGENGKAESWAGCRILGYDGVRPTLSYRQWRFNDARRRLDKGKYEFMASGKIDRGDDGQGNNFNANGNWTSMLAVGPWDLLLPGDQAHFTIAMVAGPDSASMVNNSQVAQSTFDAGFQLPSGPPSPILEVSTKDNEVILRWDPGTEPTDTYDPTTASPEYHRSEFTGDYDFQGYRVYRIDGAEITGDPFKQASLIAEFDRVTWPDGTPDTWGYNLGLPHMTADGKREFIDRGVRDGFKYWYSVTSYSNRRPRQGLEELESGFNENSILVTPGSAPGGASNPNTVGVYPNPYRGSSLFDARRPTGEPAELGRKIYFTNVPARAIISIYNISGTLVDKLQRDDASTGQVAWDMLSENTRALAPGLYVYAVENLDTGETQTGKLVILK